MAIMWHSNTKLYYNYNNFLHKVTIGRLGQNWGKKIKSKVETWQNFQISLGKIKRWKKKQLKNSVAGETFFWMVTPQDIIRRVKG